MLQIFSSAEIMAEKIPEAEGSRTADLRAHDSDNRYLIEVKTRTDDETLTAELREQGYAYRVSPLGPTNAVSGIAQHAATQLNGLHSTGEFRLVWFHVRSIRRAEETLAEQVRHTLYGISRVAGTGRGAKAPPCYFFPRERIFSPPGTRRCRDRVSRPPSALP